MPRRARIAQGISGCACRTVDLDGEWSCEMQSGGSSYSGWAAFAGVVMFIVGSLDAIWGLGAILNDDVTVVGGHGAIIADLTTWGWVHLTLGSIVALTGVGLVMGRQGARVLAIFFVTVNAIAQIVWFPAAPLWAFLIIVLDVTIIYQLTVRWDRQAAWD